MYVLCIFPAIFFTYHREKQGFKIQNAPNRLLGILYHFIKVWLITPFFIYKYINNLNNNQR